MGLPIQMLSMGSSPDGCIKQTQRILETFHVTCQVGITLLADVAKNNLQSHQIESQWRWLYVPKLCVYSRLLGWWCAWEWVSWAMGEAELETDGSGGGKHLDSDLLITSHLEAGEALRRLLLLLLVLCVGAHLGVKWPVFLSLSFLNLSAVWVTP